MKNFLQHLTDSKKTYEFAIKIADIDPADIIDRLKAALDAYGLESLSKPKRLPIKASDIDFPSLTNCQLYLMDAVLTYPVNDAQLRAIVAERGAIPAIVLGPAIIAEPGCVCTQTYVAVGSFSSKREAVGCEAYLRTKFARFLISLRKITQDLPRATYSWLPQQDWTVKWTDVELCNKYNLTKNEITFIEKMIRPMDLSNASEDE